MQSLIGPENNRHISDYLKSPSHAILVVAPSGFGKVIVMEYLAGALLNASSLNNNPSYKAVSTEENSIGIDVIRDIKSHLKLKQSSNNKRRVIVINDCHKMTIEAQNAFLKLLEEPPEDTYIVMSADNKAKLLPTFLSRVRLLPLSPYEKDDIRSYFASRGYSTEDINRYYLMSGGLAGEMRDLMEDTAKQEAFNRAKIVLSGSTYERLLMVEALSKDKKDAANLLHALKRTLLSALHSGNIKNERAKKLHKALAAVNASEEQIMKGSPNLKLLLSNMMLSM